MIDKIMGKRADVSFTKSLAPLKTGGSGAFKKYVTGLGGRGSSKIVTKCDKGGSGHRVIELPQKHVVSKITFSLTNES